MVTMRFRVSVAEIWNVTTILESKEVFTYMKDIQVAVSIAIKHLYIKAYEQERLLQHHSEH